ncbi:hypothetical protein [Propionivibrio sp.]|uniref:hypothetical protein n=1 Tax=Propionivibrio sp. TaxID=2212460 RepID=UPI00260E1ECF|nr:hypothetical protein [Propionivibrio sp.]
MFAAAHVGQHEVVDPADLQLRIEKADGDAGAEQGGQGLLAVDQPGSRLYDAGVTLDILYRQAGVIQGNYLGQAR